MEHCRHIGVITLFPEMLKSVLGTSIPDRARQKGLVEYHVWDLRSFGIGSYHSVDDYPFGGGGGMVLKPEPISAALDVAISELETLSDGKLPRLIYPSPQGRVFVQPVAKSWSEDSRPMIFLCGHYEGVDQRILDSYPFEEWSCGDYVLSGGGSCPSPSWSMRWCGSFRESCPMQTLRRTRHFLTVRSTFHNIPAPGSFGDGRFLPFFCRETMRPSNHSGRLSPGKNNRKFVPTSERPSRGFPFNHVILDGENEVYDAGS